MKLVDPREVQPGNQQQTRRGGWCRNSYLCRAYKRLPWRQTMQFGIGFRLVVRRKYAIG